MGRDLEGHEELWEEAKKIPFPSRHYFFLFSFPDKIAGYESAEKVHTGHRNWLCIFVFYDNKLKYSSVKFLKIRIKQFGKQFKCAQVLGTLSELHFKNLRDRKTQK